MVMNLSLVITIVIDLRQLRQVYYIVIPETVEDSFYFGQIYTIVKDAIFEKSTALRHVAEKKYAHEESGDAGIL